MALRTHLKRIHTLCTEVRSQIIESAWSRMMALATPQHFRLQMSYFHTDIKFCIKEIVSGRNHSHTIILFNVLCFRNEPKCIDY